MCPFWAFYPLGPALGKQAAATLMELPSVQFINLSSTGGASSYW